MQWTRRDWLILLGLTLLAAALRLYKLGEVPPGFQFDEAFNAIDAAGVLAGNRPLFLPANAGREVLYTYWQTAIITLTGGAITPYTLRLGSALTGIIAIPVAYLLLRALLRRDSRRIAFFATAAFAVNLWHIHFSHFGIRTIMMPPILSGVFGFFWWAAQSERRDHRLWGFVASGLCTGLAVWTHPTGRLVPLALMGYVLWLMWRMSSSQRWTVRHLPDHPLGGLLLTGLVSFIIFLPLGWQFVQRPDFFLEHAGEAFILNEEVSDGSPLRTLLDHTVRVLGMFTLRGDRDWTHNVPERPAFDPLLAIPFLVGVALWVGRMAGIRLAPRRNDDEPDPDRDALVLLALWLVVMLLPSVLSNDAPDFSRTQPAHPALFTPVGLGLTWLATRRWFTPWFAPSLAGAILVISGAWAFYDYFVDFPQRTEVYYVYDVDKLDALNTLAPYTKDNQVYLSRLWAGHATVTFLRSQYGIKSIDTSDTLVLPPPGESAVYAFPAEQEERAEQIVETLPGTTLRSVPDRHGKTLLYITQTDAAHLRAWPPALTPQQTHEAHFAQAPTLLGMRTEPNDTSITLFWRAEERMVRDLTSFVHLLDVDGRRVGQIDKIPGNGSYRTPAWSPGERVIDRYRPAVDDVCAGGEDVRVVVGWYEWAANNARRPRTDTAGNTAVAGRMTLPLRSVPPAAVAPDTVRQVEVNEPLTLLGYSLRQEAWQAGTPLVLDLFWQGDASVADQPLAVSLQADGQDDGESEALWQGKVAPDAAWDDDQALCRRLRLRLPDDATAGNYTVQLQVAGTVIPLAALTLAESTRRFDVPSDLTPVDVVFGSTPTDAVIQLAGFAADAPGADSDVLTVLLAWQAVSAPPKPYKVFVHLLDEEERIVAQSDAEPAGGYATNRWVRGEVVVDEHVLTLPSALSAGAHHIVTGLYDPLTGQRLAAYDATDQPMADNAVLLDTIEVP